LGKVLFLPSKTDLRLTNRRARLPAAVRGKSPLEKQWTAVAAARAQIKQIEKSLVLVRLYETARTYFISDC